MKKNRLEAFSDGVIAILITIMVLELRAPHGDDLNSLKPLLPIFLSYVLSFFYLAIYWNNHHHLLQVTKKINGVILWANFHLLFWLSLIPFATAWSGENNFTAWPVALYGFVLLMSSFSYFILAKTLALSHEADSDLVVALGKDWKGKISVILYALSLPLAFYYSYISLGIYVIVAIVWLIPDSRLANIPEENLHKKD